MTSEKESPVVDRDERRKIERYDLKLQGFVSVSGAEQTKRPVYLETKDVSKNGAYFITPDPLPVGTKVDVDLILKVGDVSSAAAKKAWIKASGAVYRIDQRGMVIRFDEDSKILPFSAEMPQPKK